MNIPVPSTESQQCAYRMINLGSTYFYISVSVPKYKLTKKPKCPQWHTVGLAEVTWAEQGALRLSNGHILRPIKHRQGYGQRSNVLPQPRLNLFITLCLELRCCQFVFCTSAGNCSWNEVCKTGPMATDLPQATDNVAVVMVVFWMCSVKWAINGSNKIFF
jgi:hypothetical protein